MNALLPQEEILKKAWAGKFCVSQTLLETKNVGMVTCSVLLHRFSPRLTCICKDFQSSFELTSNEFFFCLDSTVFSSNHKSNPEMKKQWLVAKGLVEIVDMIVCQLEHHLTDTHLTQMMFCNVFRRHFSSRHPLYTIIQIHCQGTTPATMLGLPVLIKENQYTDNLFYFGGKGARKLVNKHYIRQHYDDNDFRLILKVKTPFLKKSMCIWSQTTFRIRLPFC